MNKINCNAEIHFKNFPVGTIFKSDGDYFIKINNKVIFDGIAFVTYKGECVVDETTLPNAISLIEGRVAYFQAGVVIDAIYPSATINIE